VGQEFSISLGIWQYLFKKGKKIIFIFYMDGLPKWAEICVEFTKRLSVDVKKDRENPLEQTLTGV
jgi:hypothetical protein